MTDFSYTVKKITGKCFVIEIYTTLCWWHLSLRHNFKEIFIVILSTLSEFTLFSQYNEFKLFSQYNASLW